MNLEQTVKKLKNVQAANAALLAKRTKIKENMVAAGLTDKCQQFGMVAICEDATKPSSEMVIIDCEDQAAASAQANSAQEDRSMVRFRFDTGATHHFSNTNVAVDDVKRDTSKVSTAKEGHDIQLSKQGTFTSEAEGQDTSLEFDVKQSDAFSMNLFSGFRAVKDGCRVVLDKENSYIVHTETGTRFPLEMTSSGWDLVLRNGSTAAKRAYGALSNDT